MSKPTPTPLDKFAIAAALQEIATLLELKGGTDRFKARAYQTGARVVAACPKTLAKQFSETDCFIARNR